MSSPVFTDHYAAFYDIVYKDKAYAAECQELADIFAEHSNTPVRSILDLGCGTGGHVVELSKLGYSVVGVDRSQAMLAQATEKLGQEKIKARLVESDIRELSLKEEFDACVCMFAVICYMLSNEDLERAIKCAFQHTKAGGLFVFDYWYGPAVLSVRPETRVRAYQDNERELIRIAVPHLDTKTHSNEIEYMLIEKEGDKVTREVVERHRVRYLFPLELQYYLTKAGFEHVASGAFPNPQHPISDEHWNAITVARKPA